MSQKREKEKISWMGRNNLKKQKNGFVEETNNHENKKENKRKKGVTGKG